jgi:hypothetical protein
MLQICICPSQNNVQQNHRFDNAFLVGVIRSLTILLEQEDIVKPVILLNIVLGGAYADLQHLI